MKIWPTDMYRVQCSPIVLCAVVVHECAVLEVHVDAQDSQQCIYNYEICILLDKLVYKHLTHVMHPE